MYTETCKVVRSTVYSVDEGIIYVFRFKKCMGFVVVLLEWTYNVSVHNYNNFKGTYICTYYYLFLFQQVEEILLNPWGLLALLLIMRVYNVPFKISSIHRGNKEAFAFLCVWEIFLMYLKLFFVLQGDIKERNVSKCKS